MEVIPQKLYSIDGVLAHLAGEWPGSKHSHWNSSKRLLKPIDRKNIVQKGIKTFGVLAKSAELEYRPAFKIITEKLNSSNEETTPKRGKKYLKPNYSDPKTYPLKLLHGNVTIKPPEIRNRRQFAFRFDDFNNESSLEKLTGQKAKLPTLEARRNFLSAYSPGDKIYRNVEYSPDFFKEGGLIVGSTNKISYNKSSGKKLNLFYSSLDLGVKVLDQEKLWKNKELRESIECDNRYVCSLNLWEEDVLKPYLPPKDKNLGNVSAKKK
jgi:hypothetical protein